MVGGGTKNGALNGLVAGIIGGFIVGILIAHGVNSVTTGSNLGSFPGLTIQIVMLS